MYSICVYIYIARYFPFVKGSESYNLLVDIKYLYLSTVELV